MGNKFSILKSEVNKEHPRVGELPFDSDRKMMSTQHSYDDKKRSYTKGAIDNILKRSSKIYDDGKIRNITDKDLEGKPNFADILPDFLKFCKDCILVAHNQEYDVKIVSRYARENAYKFLNSSMCTLEMSRKYLTMNTRHRLQDVAEYYGVTNIHAHRAIGDVEVTAKVFAELVRFLG
jgi:DNA polymerase III alpha subunit (gram-positive type)